MTDESKLLTRNLSFIKDNITDIDSVLDKLIEDDVLRLEDRSRILINKNPRLQIHDMLEIVLKKSAFENFINALEASGNNHIIERLKITDINSEKKDDSKESTLSEFDQCDGYEDKDKSRKTENIIKLEKELQNLQSENNHLREQQRRVRIELDTKHKKMQELNREVYLHKNQNEKLKGRLALLHNSNKLTEKLKTIEQELEEKDTAHDKLESEVLSKEKELEELKIECGKLRQELAEKTDKISSLDDQVKALREDLIVARKERHELKVMLDEINTNVDSKWKIMMNVLENRLNHNRRISTRGSTETGTLLPSLQTNQSATFKFIDNRYSISPKEKTKAKFKQAQAANSKTTGSKKTAFITTKSRTFNKYLK